MRWLRTIGIAVAAATALAASSAAEARGMHVACEVLVPAAEVPGDDGTYLTILRLTVPAGDDSHMHFHAAAEYFAVVSGSGSLTIEGRDDMALSPGNHVTIPPHVNHQIHNHSATEPMVYTATIVGRAEDPLLTRYVGEPDKPSGCPHRRKPKS